MDFDDPFRTGLAQMLRDDAHEVLDFASPAEMPPLDELRHVGMLIAEYLLPGEHGIALAHRVHRVRPGLPILLVSIYLARPLGGHDFMHALPKPIEYDHLHEHIHRLVR